MRFLSSPERPTFEYLCAVCFASPLIERTLASGTSIICDRYAFSGIAFSAAKGLPYEWCRGPDISLPAPDLILFLDIAPEIARTRGGYGAERYEKEELQARVRGVFERIGEEMRERWNRLDAGRGREEVAEEIWEIVANTLRNVTALPDAPLDRLWVG